MIICRVRSQVVSTVKHSVYTGQKIFIVQALDPEGNETGDQFIACDTVDSGIGDAVLVSQEGISAREIVGDMHAPVRSMIVAVIDDIELE